MAVAALSYATLLSSPHGKSPAHVIAPFPIQFSNCLVTGPASSGLSSVAAMFALNMVAGSITQGAGGAGGGVTRDVVVLCTRQHSDSHPPTLAPGMDNTHPYMRHVKIRYLASHIELRQYAGCMHLLPSAPAAIVVDGIGTFFRPEMDKKSRERELAKTLAMLVDGVEAMRPALGGVCPLLVTDEAPSTDSDPASKHLMYVFQRWLPLVLEVKGTAKTGLAMSVSPSCPAYSLLQPQLQVAQVHYSLVASLSVTGADYGNS